MSEGAERILGNFQRLANEILEESFKDRLSINDCHSDFAKGWTAAYSVANKLMAGWLQEEINIIKESLKEE